MQPGDVIRKYRKNKDMTQEEMAKRLGVTAPAVNKWENGNALPDITLLAPIARLLGITTDILLSFRDELTGDELRAIIYELDSMLKEKPYGEVFLWAKKKLEEYPNCEELILQIAIVLDAQRIVQDLAGEKEYDDYICSLYARMLESDDEAIRSRAADALFGFYMRKEKYEKAEEYLKYFSIQNPERKRKQAWIYSKTNRTAEAYKAYEELLFSFYQMASGALHGIYMLALEQGDMERAHMLVKKQEEMARCFEMSKYNEVSSRLEIATLEKDADTVIATMKEMLSSIGQIGSYRESSLYADMDFKELQEEFLTDLKHNLLECFRNEESYGFLKNDKRWQEIIRQNQ